MNSSSSSTVHNIALSFSGGGFRAAGFSLGTMVLLRRIDWLKKVQIISSASGGSITAAFFVVAKAHFVSQPNKSPKAPFSFDQFIQQFYTPLKSFLESESVVDSILKDLGGTEKVIKKAANCYQQKLREIAGYSTSDEEIMKQIWKLLQDKDISPDCLSINATNMTNASLFRFAFLVNEDVKAVVIGKKYLNIDEIESDPDKIKLYKQLRLGDMIAASSCFPIGFEPILYPDDFSVNKTVKDELRQFLRNQEQVALMDAGLYDNLALTSIESLRQDTKKDENKNGSNVDLPLTLPYPINFVIATDADNLEPASALLDPQELNQGLGNLSKPIIDILGFIFKLIDCIVKCYDTLKKSFTFLDKLVHWLLKYVPLLDKLVHWLLKYVPLLDTLVRWLFSKFGIKEINAQIANSWKKSLSLRGLINLLPDRVKELSPTFGAFLKRNRNLTYQFLQYKYEQESKISLIRNLIFDLYNRNDNDANLKELAPKLTNIAQVEESSPEEKVRGMIGKINTFALTLKLRSMDNQYHKKAILIKLIQTFKQEQRTNQKYLICLAKLATALPTTLWLKWYTVCQVQTKQLKGASQFKDSPSDFMEAILEDNSLCVWKTQKRKCDDPNLLIEFASQESETMVTAAEVVIACGFVAACYNILEYSANLIDVIYSEPEPILDDQKQKLADYKLTKIRQQIDPDPDEKNSAETSLSDQVDDLNSKGEYFSKELANKLDEIIPKDEFILKGIEKAALIWWELISFTPSGSDEKEKLHSFIKNILQQMTASMEETPKT